MLLVSGIHRQVIFITAEELRSIFLSFTSVATRALDTVFNLHSIHGVAESVPLSLNQMRPRRWKYMVASLAFQ